jgi:polar amino acid transport system substrate-binding protein
MIMLNRKNLFLLVLLITALLFAFTGCAPAEDVPVDVPDEEPEEDAAPEGDGSLQRVLDAGVLVVVGSGGYPPFNFYGEDDPDTPIGFDVDTGKAIAERLGVELVYETSDWDGLPDGLRAGRYDAILGSMADTEARRQIVSFTIPYYYSGAQLIVREDSGIEGPADVAGLDIGVITGETYVDDAINLGANDVHYAEVNTILLEVIGGRIDGMITDRLVAINGMNEIARGDELIMAGELIRTENVAVALRQEDVELREKISEILAELHADGTMTEISMLWHGIDITKP